MNLSNNNLPSGIKCEKPARGYVIRYIERKHDIYYKLKSKGHDRDFDVDLIGESTGSIISFEVTDAAAKVHEYTDMCMKGEISRQEYIELVKDIQRQLNINQHMVEQDNLLLMNTAINGLINLASLA